MGTANAIDSFVVEIGLDPKNFTKGQREALDAFKRTQEEALKGGKEIENQSKRSMESLGSIKTQALELFAVFSGGKSLINFTTGLINAGGALGRMERNIGVSANTISRWQGAARIFGGDATAMAQSFTQISDALAGWKVGDVSPLIAEFRALSTAGGTLIDINKGVDQTYRDIAANLKAVHDRDPALAGRLGRRLGLDPGLFDLLVQGPKALQQVLDYVNKIGTATSADADAFGELEKRMNQMGIKAESLGRKVLNANLGNGDTPAGMVMGVADWLNLPPGEAWDAMVNRLKKEWGAAPSSGSSGPSKLFGDGATGAFTRNAEKEAFIRSEAVKRGLDPDVMVKVAKSEGFDNFLGDNGTSGGAFQLHVTPGGRGRAVGDMFKAKTGLDPLDPTNERASIQFALDDIRANGLGAYHGAARVGLAANAGGAGGNITTTKIDVNGPITIQAGNTTDGAAIATKFTETLRRQSFAAQANGGQN